MYIDTLRNLLRKNGAISTRFDKNEPLVKGPFLLRMKIIHFTKRGLFFLIHNFAQMGLLSGTVCPLRKV